MNKHLTNFNTYLSSNQAAILSTICYYDIFNHPLTFDELRKNYSDVNSEGDLANDLNELAALQLLKREGDYFFLFTQPKKIIDERLKKEARAKEIMNKALFFGKLIGAFPFVEGVCISGSLSKGVLDEDGDVDFFIITKPSRIWLCRSLLILFKKIVLLNSKKYFCVNYFVDSNHLSIPDKNIFTATEINSLLPVVNYAAYRDFIFSNGWTKDFFSNNELWQNKHCAPKNKNYLKQFLEFILKGSLGEYADNFFFTFTLKHWKKKFRCFNEKDFDLNLRSRKSVSKHHPRGYQQKVLHAYEKKVEMVFESMKNKLVPAA